MANFDVNLQDELKKWEEGNHSGDLIVGVYRYNKGEPKVGFNRYIERKDGVIITKAGRLNWSDLMYLESIWDEIKETMEAVK